MLLSSALGFSALFGPFSIPACVVRCWTTCARVGRAQVPLLARDERRNREEITTWKLLRFEVEHVHLLCWHQHVQDVRTRVALGQQLLDEVEETLQRLTRYRPDLLPDSICTLCECKPFRCRSRGGGALEQ